LQEFDWVLGVADKKLFERACHAGWRLDQTFPVWIIAGPSNNGSKRSFDISPVGPANLGPQGLIPSITCTFKLIEMLSSRRTPEWDLLPPLD